MVVESVEFHIMEVVYHVDTGKAIKQKTDIRPYLFSALARESHLAYFVARGKPVGFPNLTSACKGRSPLPSPVRFLSSTTIKKMGQAHSFYCALARNRT